MTKEERSFVESMLLAGDAGQEGSFVDDSLNGMEAQKTVKINQLSFNENGETKEQTRSQISATPPWCSEQLDKHVSMTSDNFALLTGMLCYQGVASYIHPT